MRAESRARPTTWSPTSKGSSKTWTASPSSPPSGSAIRARSPRASAPRLSARSASTRKAAPPARASAGESTSSTPPSSRKSDRSPAPTALKRAVDAQPWWLLLRRTRVLGGAGIHGASTPGLDFLDRHHPFQVVADLRVRIHERLVGHQRVQHVGLFIEQGHPDAGLVAADGTLAVALALLSHGQHADIVDDPSRHRYRLALGRLRCHTGRHQEHERPHQDPDPTQRCHSV